MTRRSSPKTMTDEERRAKNNRIRETSRATRQRRATMDCKVYTLKIVSTRLNASQRESIERLFLEAKWVRNALIAGGEFTREALAQFRDFVPVKTPQGVDNREISIIGGQLAQGVLAEVKRNLKTLSTLKKKGRKVGSLKFTSQVNSVDFVQYGVSWAINAESKKIRLANIPGWMKVHGVRQIPDDAEYANAKLVRKPSGLYLRITVFIPKAKPCYEEGTVVGVDMGVKDGLTFSDGTKITALFGEPERVKRLRRKLSRQKKGSNKYRKTLTLIERELEKVSHKKDDSSNKIVHELAKNERIYFQDENISSWRRRRSLAGGSKRVHQGILGRVKSRLSVHNRAVMLDRFLPTTQLCVCGRKNKIPLSERMYSCECGYREDRDIHAALNMMRIGSALEQEDSPGLGRTGTPVEFLVRPAEMSFVGINVGAGTVKREAARP